MPIRYLYELKGVDGIDGSATNTGATGPQGLSLTGATGPQGPSGSSSNTGATGPAGTQGSQGEIGSTGPQGQSLTGATGPQGLSLTGATGPQGSQGSIGATGPQGSIGHTGPQGEPGTSSGTGATGPQGSFDNTPIDYLTIPSDTSDSTEKIGKIYHSLYNATSSPTGVCFISGYTPSSTQCYEYIGGGINSDDRAPTNIIFKASSDATNSSTNELVSQINVSGVTVLSGALNMSNLEIKDAGKVNLDSGSVSNPSLTYTSSTGTVGQYYDPNSLNGSQVFTHNNNAKMYIGSNVYFPNQVLINSGSAGAPIIYNSSHNAGIDIHSSRVNNVVGGVDKSYTDSNGFTVSGEIVSNEFRANTSGSLSDPVYMFNGVTGGFYSGSGQIHLASFNEDKVILKSASVDIQSDVTMNSNDISGVNSISTSSLNATSTISANDMTGSIGSFESLYVNDIIPSPTGVHINGLVSIGDETYRSTLNVVGDDIANSEGITIGNTLTDSTLKYARIRGLSYNTDEPPVTMTIMTSNINDNVCHLGGGSSHENASTSIRMFCATGPNQTTGNEIIRVGYNNVTIGHTIQGNALCDCRHSRSDLVVNRSSALSSSYATAVIYGNCSRSASSAYNLLQLDSLGDTEFAFKGDGNAFADGTFSGGGADYAEYFEIKPNESPLEHGDTVVIDTGYIRKSDVLDLTSSIIGVVRPKINAKSTCIVGNSSHFKWNDKYLTDDYGVYQLENCDVYEWSEEEEVLNELKETVIKSTEHSYEWDKVPENIIVPENKTVKVIQRRVINPAYDPNIEYINREERDEWYLIGLLGQIPVKASSIKNPKWIKMNDITQGVTEKYFVC